MELSEFGKGCERAAWIVGASPSVREVVLSNMPDDARELTRIPQASARALAFRHILEQRLGKARLYETDFHDIIFFGKTDNNRKEFVFLREVLLERNMKFSSVNFSDNFRYSNLKVNSDHAICNAIAEQADAFLSKFDYQAEYCWQIAQYAPIFAQIYLSYIGKLDLLPKIAVVANDHSPSQVAFKAAMDELSVPVVYLQHAEVSRAFPPLDFNLSILRNEVSLELYQAIAPIRGRAMVVSRRSSEARFADVIGWRARHPDQVTVGIYPTSHFDLETISRISSLVNSNPHVGDCFIKLHPRAKMDSTEASRLNVRKDTPDFPHVALVGNSSVAIELLGGGVPVFQIFELDTIEADYYGFVSSGLTAPVSIDAVSTSAFWVSDFYDDRWLARTARFEPSAAGSGQESRRELATLIEKMLVSKPTGPIVKFTEPENRRDVVKPAQNDNATLPARTRLNRIAGKLLERITSRLARQFPREFNRLAFIVASSVPEGARSFHLQASSSVTTEADKRASKPPVTSGQAAKPAAAAKRGAKPIVTGGRTSKDGARRTRDLAKLMDEASDPFSLADALFNTATTATTKAEIIAWFNEKWAQRDSRAFAFVRSAAAQSSAKSDLWLRMLVHEMMATPLSSSSAESWINELSEIEEPSLRRLYETLAMRILIRNDHISSYFELIRRSPVHRINALSSNMKVEVAKHVFADRVEIDEEGKRKFLTSLSDYERAKISASGGHEFLKLLDHKSLEEKFAQLTHVELSREFRSVVSPAYDALRTNMTYINARVSAEERQALIDRISEALEKRESFSLVRLGDGEAYLVGSDDMPFSRADRMMRERHWWNRELEPSVSAYIRERGVAALETADVVGVPSIHRFFRDFSEKSTQLLGSTANRGVVTSLLGAAALLGEGVAIAEDRVHHLVFSPAVLRQLLRIPDRVIVVSSLREEVVRNGIGEFCKRLEVIEIPTHAKTAQNPYFSDSIVSLPFVISDVEAHLRREIGAGDLVLISAGVAGKGLIGLAKKQGAIALDLGGQIEPLAGVPNGALF